MSHIHIPDGVLPVWIVLLGWVITGGLLTYLLNFHRKEIIDRLALLGIISAIMVIIMSLEIAPISYHMNLTVIAGLILGPAAGFLAAFVVTTVLALFGHGGITVIGLNALTIGSETFTSYYLFHFFIKIFRNHLILTTVVTTVIALFISTWLMIGIISAGRAAPEFEEHRPVPVQSLNLRIPMTDKTYTHILYKSPPGKTQEPELSYGTFIKLILALGLIGWALESIVNSFLIRYITRIRPDIIMSNRGIED